MRKSGRKALAVLLTSAMVLTGAAGCGSGSGSQMAQTTAASSEAEESAAQTESTQDKSTQGEEDAKKNAASEKGLTGDEEDKERYQKTPEPAAADGSRFLFVGNSHTYVNDLPGVFSELAFAGGHDVDVYDLTEGMYTLKQFSDPEDELGAVLTEALGTEPWDFVILQENTNAALSGQPETDMFPCARILDKEIQASGAQTAFFMTWSPEEGAGVVSRKVVQAILSKNYQSIAKELDALLIPGGDLFLEALSEDENLLLWGDDGQHPSEAGTYLTACAAYALFFQETPEGNPYLFSLDEETAGELQQIAASYMLGEE